MKIGLEVHVALPTKTKLFCSCSMEAEEPNTSICPICMGFPGSKPMLNEAAVEAALSIANALRCKINKKISFVRKVYFYPDLPKSYQITQMAGSIGHEGYLEMDEKKVRIRRVQIEEDPAKIVKEGAFTLLDFNRCGTPLVEIVTEPDIKSMEELWSFIRTLRSLLYYLEVDINKEIKADLNISIADIRVEVKNVTGIKNLIEAAKYEIERQNAVLKEGEEIARETRGYNEKRKTTETLREKETDEEYGYIYEPDLTVFEIEGLKSKEPVYINEVADGIAKKYATNPKTIRELTMLDRHSLYLINKFKDKYKMKSIIHGIERFKKYRGEKWASDYVIDRIVKLVEDDKIVTKEMIGELEKGKKVKVEYAKFTNKEIDRMIEKFIDENKNIIDDYKKNKKAMNLIIGKITEKSNLHPKDVAKRVLEILNRS